jgi:hypothetical protein
MEADREKAIEARAYQLWEESDQAHGMQDMHWRQAERAIDGAAEEAVDGVQESRAEEKPTENVTSMPQREAREDVPKRSKK